LRTVAPCNSARTSPLVASSAASGEGGYAPTWRIQLATPGPKPAVSRPGWAPASVATSIAASAPLRRTAGRMPIPTCARSVAASARAALATPEV